MVASPLFFLTSLSPVIPGTETLRVADLIDEDSKEWKMEVLEAFFTMEEASSIGRVPLGIIPTGNRFIWHFKEELVQSKKLRFCHKKKKFKEASSYQSAK